MNKKGQSQVPQIGVFIGLFIVLLVGLILLQSSAQNVGDVVNTVSVVNDTFAAPANGASANLQGRAAASFVAINASGGEIIAAGNYTVNDNQVVNGVVQVTLTVDDTQYQSINWNVSYVYEPETFIGSSGGRALANLIILMFAIALVVLSILPVVREKFGV
ncbi:hypothetical protein LCGC14_1955780 [marine sediment metagenome]|uniref:Uncharacterized protein n=1 Tax=marine sediment metagenome TaxID=412755 RepID=A0A0F9G4J0_9ZZZZ